MNTFKRGDPARNYADSERLSKAKRAVKFIGLQACMEDFEIETNAAVLKCYFEQVLQEKAKVA